VPVNIVMSQRAREQGPTTKPRLSSIEAATFADGLERVRARSGNSASCAVL
jgi:hypothetical protein